MAKAYWNENGRWLCGGPEDFFGTADGMPPGKMISFVGGGGKTSTMFYLAEVYSRRGLKTAVMTTTRIRQTEVFCNAPEQWEKLWAEGKYAVCGEAADEIKLRSMEKELVDILTASADVVLIEADGAGTRPCKAPAPYEPVILPECDVVVGVMGLDAAGRPVSEVCFRTEIVCSRLGCGQDHLLTCDDMADLMTRADCMRKDADGRMFFAVYNKCDDEERLETGRTLCRMTEARGVRAVLTCMKPGGEWLRP